MNTANLLHKGSHSGRLWCCICFCTAILHLGTPGAPFVMILSIPLPLSLPASHSTPLPVEEDSNSNNTATVRDFKRREKRFCFDADDSQVLCVNFSSWRQRHQLRNKKSTRIFQTWLFALVRLRWTTVLKVRICVFSQSTKGLQLYDLTWPRNSTRQYKVTKALLISSGLSGKGASWRNFRQGAWTSILMLLM